jgi:6-phosphogluconate dehydrogenase
MSFAGQAVVSGIGSWYCLMIGDRKAVRHLDPIFKPLRRAGAISRTPGRGFGGTEEDIFTAGLLGGHLLKWFTMESNMASWPPIQRTQHSHHANVGKRHAVDAETTPLREHRHYQYDFDQPISRSFGGEV